MKCEQRSVWFSPPESFSKIFKGEKIFDQEVLGFQEKYRLENNL